MHDNIKRLRFVINVVNVAAGCTQWATFTSSLEVGHDVIILSSWCCYGIASRARVSGVLAGQVETELGYAYAKMEDVGALEEFMSGTHQANLQSVGDRVFDEGMFEAARAIFAHIPNWGCLASTLVRLHQFQQAVDAARRANSPKIWKEVRFFHPSQAQDHPLPLVRETCNRPVWLRRD